MYVHSDLYDLQVDTHLVPGIARDAQQVSMWAVCSVGFDRQCCACGGDSALQRESFGSNMYDESTLHPSVRIVVVTSACAK